MGLFDNMNQFNAYQGNALDQLARSIYQSQQSAPYIEQTSLSQPTMTPYQPASQYDQSTVSGRMSELFGTPVTFYGMRGPGLDGTSGGK